MSFFLFPNPDDDKWIRSYNDLISEIKTGKRVFSDDVVQTVETSPGRFRKVGLGKHHIIPRSLRPDLTKDKDNIVILPFADHMTLHYFLWRADPKYARQLWFGACFGRKHHLWNLPGGEEEYERLKADLKRRKNNVQNLEI